MLLELMFILKKLLIGTSDGGIKVWNVDAKRVVCDLSCTEAFPRFLTHIDLLSSLGKKMKYLDTILLVLFLIPISCFLEVVCWT